MSKKTFYLDVGEYVVETNETEILESIDILSWRLNRLVFAQRNSNLIETLNSVQEALAKYEISQRFNL